MIIEEKINLIKEYIDEEECILIRGSGLFDCCGCVHFEECYIKAENECNNDINHATAYAINYGGYETEEDFWSELLE